MANYRMESEEEALFRSYPYAVYYVQSPSTASHANSTSGDLRAGIGNNNEPMTYHHHDDADHLRPSSASADAFNNISSKNNNNPRNQLVALSRYSSRGSTNDGDGRQNHVGTHHVDCNIVLQDDRKTRRHGDDHDDEEEEEDKGLYYAAEKEEEEEEDVDDIDELYYYGEKGGCWRYLSFSYSSSSIWIALQISWRLLLSLFAALLVFYLATKPPTPKVSVQMAGIPEFGLGEGVDGSGVTTKMLTSNCTIDLIIDNKSKLFGLHLHPPLVAMAFANLPFAFSRGESELYAEPYGATVFRLYIGTRNKAMYGAGRSMQDYLQSGKGLPLIIQLNLRSSFHVVWGLIKPKFRHQAVCLLLLHNAYDKQRRTQMYNSSCTLHVI